jgi:multidrug efflux pump subunit AcrB
LAAILPIAWAGWSSYQSLGTGFMPSMDEGGFVLDYRSAPGSSLSETDRLLRQVEAILQRTPEVETYSRRTGLQLGGGVTEANEGDFFIRLKAGSRRPIDEVMDDVRNRVQRDVPGLDIELAQLMEDLIGDLIANPHPIEVILSGADGETLRRSATEVAKRIEQVRGVVDINNGVVVAGDAQQITVNRDAAALEGVDPAEIAHQVENAVEGNVVATVQRGELLSGVRIWLPPHARAIDEQVANLPLHGPDGHLFPLSRVARLEPVTGQPQITHLDLERVVAVTARISGRDLGSTIGDLRTVLDGPGALPSGVTYRLGGIYAQQQQAFRDLAMVLGSALVLVFLLLVFLYESLRMALAMLLTTLLSLAGVMVGLRLTGMELNITALMGTTMVVGIVTEVSILFASAFTAGALDRDRGERLIDAGLARMRPIMMTVVAAALALAPLAIGLGEGSDMQRPLAIAIISGLLLQLPLAVVVLPMLLACVRIR